MKMRPAKTTKYAPGEARSRAPLRRPRRLENPQTMFLSGARFRAAQEKSRSSERSPGPRDGLSPSCAVASHPAPEISPGLTQPGLAANDGSDRRARARAVTRRSPVWAQSQARGVGAVLGATDLARRSSPPARPPRGSSFGRTSQARLRSWSCSSWAVPRLATSRPRLDHKLLQVAFRTLFTLLKFHKLNQRRSAHQG